ncbi:MAG: mechanosensitive ion channel family protein [Lachnospiraceae bacterium]|nr:mechanosensitive ion channel family protein [Lachnospiraceae bacterium]
MDSKFLEQLAQKAGDLGLRILFAVIFFIVGVQIIKLIRKITKKAMNRANADIGVIQFVDSFVKAALYIVLVFMLASYFGVDAASIVALLGSAGVAIGLAVQGSLSNLAGGVLILLLKPFKVGDYIVESGHGMEGTVIEISIFYTKLKTFDNRIIILPNGNLANNSLTNVTGADTRRLDIPFSISYDSDIRTAKKVLEELLKSDEKVMKGQDVFVVVDELADSGVNMSMHCWVRTEDYWKTKWRLTEQCKYTLEGAGITIPFPQLDVHLEQ